MAGLLYFKFGTQKSGIDHHLAPYVRDLVPDTIITFVLHQAINLIQHILIVSHFVITHLAR
jgi:hypothetical protein